jgi:hypothetical protein
MSTDKYNGMVYLISIVYKKNFFKWTTCWDDLEVEDLAGV